MNNFKKEGGGVGLRRSVWPWIMATATLATPQLLLIH